jgi:hypothetical protein
VGSKNKRPLSEISEKKSKHVLKKKLENGKSEKFVKVHLISVSASCQHLLPVPQVLL